MVVRRVSAGATPRRTCRAAHWAGGSSPCTWVARNSALLLYRGPGELRERCERRLRRVQAKAEVLVAERREDVGWLMPVGVPSGADLTPTLVLTQAHRGDDVLERRAVGVRHVRPDLRR